MKTFLIPLPLVLLLATPLAAQQTPAPILRRTPEPAVSPALLNPAPITLPLSQATAQTPTSTSAGPQSLPPAPPVCYQPYPCCYPRPRHVPSDFNGPLFGTALFLVIMGLVAIRGM